MAITNAQQAKQILMEDGGPVVQAGVKNYKPSKMVTVPKVARSSPTHPIAKLAYITDAEKKLLIKKNLHGSLKGKPNRGPGGIPSLQGDFGGPGGFGGFEGGGGSRSDDDVSGRRDTGTGDYRDSTRPADVAARREYERNRAAREKAEKERQEKERVQKEIDKYNKAQAKKAKSFKDKTMADLLSEEEEETRDFDVFDTNQDGKIGPLEFLNKQRTKLAKKTLTNSIAQKLGIMPKTLVPSFLTSDMVRKSPKGVNLNTLEDMLAPDFDMGLYGVSGEDLTRAQKQLDVAKQDIISQKDFESVYGNRPPPSRDDGPDPVIPIVPPIAQTPKSQDDTEEEDFQLALAFRKDGGRVPYEDGGYTGGIMDLETGRQMYFLGKLVKKATRAFKKIVKSPVGKIGMGIMAAKFAPALIGQYKAGSGLGGLFAKGLTFAKQNPLVTSLAGGALAGLLQSKGLKDENQDGLDDETGLDIEAILKDPGGKGGLQGRFDYGSFKDGGMPAEEGMMNLQGMEMDFREDGGFVPIGKKERADDVPARLSKNEFVMTADAVRGAGDGDIDKGAEKMYNLMSKLEAENDQSQGLDGARKMFKTAQRLEEVL